MNDLHLTLQNYFPTSYPGCITESKKFSHIASVVNSQYICITVLNPSFRMYYRAYPVFWFIKWSLLVNVFSLTAIAHPYGIYWLCNMYHQMLYLTAFQCTVVLSTHSITIFSDVQFFNFNHFKKYKTTSLKIQLQFTVLVYHFTIRKLSSK